MKYDNSVPTSKTALFLINLIVFTYFAIMVGLMGQEYPSPEIYQITATEQSEASGEVSVESSIRAIAREENFQEEDYLVKLALCESGLYPLAVGDGGMSKGLYQIHEKYHPNVKDSCKFDVRCSTLWTIDKINKGQRGIWTCDRYIIA